VRRLRIASAVQRANRGMLGITAILLLSSASISSRHGFGFEIEFDSEAGGGGERGSKASSIYSQRGHGVGTGWSVFEGPKSQYRQYPSTRKRIKRVMAIEAKKNRNQRLLAVFSSWMLRNGPASEAHSFSFETMVQTAARLLIDGLGVREGVNARACR
jgi:hypothetical protein